MADDDAFLPTLLTAGSDPLVRTWLKVNHDQFQAGLAGRRADWNRLAKAFDDAGFRNRWGRPPQAEALRKLWRIIQHEVAAEREAKRSHQTAQPAAAPAPNDEGAAVLAAMRARGKGLTDPLK